MTTPERPSRLTRATACGSALLLGVGMLAGATAMAPGAQAAVGQGFDVTPADLAYILDQIKIAEDHATIEQRDLANNPILGATDGATPVTGAATPGGGTTVNFFADPLLSLGLRQVDGRNNNLTNTNWGASDVPFPKLVPGQNFRPTEPSTITLPPGVTAYQNSGGASSYGTRSGSVSDGDPRVVSNIVVDQSPSNPAAVAAAGPGAVAEPGPVPGAKGSLFMPNVAPDNGLSAPFNSVFTLFGQFFDHGLDLVAKTGTEVVVVPLKPGDPLYEAGAPTNFMIANRTKIGNIGGRDFGPSGTNGTTPFVDQNQTYTSHPSHQVFLREYALNAGKPVATGKLLDSPAFAGNIATWGDVKNQARTHLGIQLQDVDVFNVPLLLTDEYGRFLRGPRGFAQVILSANPAAAGVNCVAATGSFVCEGTPATPVPTAGSVGTGHAFLDDIAHNAVPDNNYDQALLEAHYITGDGRGNENIGLTAIHTVFHAEHNRLVDDIKLTLDANPTLKLAYQAVPVGQTVEERLFQAARFVTEMEYQHLVFEEFARKIQPSLRAFGGYNPGLRPDINAEFAHAVYRFGHSMLTETIARVNGGGNGVQIPARGKRNDISLFSGFLNPREFNKDGFGGTFNGPEAAGAIMRGMAQQVGNEIDEFVTESLRNRLVGLPLDLATLNIVRGRDTGTGTLNDTRAAVGLPVYNSWAQLASGLENGLPAKDFRHSETVVNLIAAYGTHASITGATSIADKRAAAQALVQQWQSKNPSSAGFVFMTDTANRGQDDIDLWVGGLAEKPAIGSMLGATFDAVFTKQLEVLQEGDRFYYLERTAGMNLLTQLEGNSLSEIIARNTDADNLPAAVFSRPGFVFDLRNTGNFCGVVEDDPNTLLPQDESVLLAKELLPGTATGTVSYTVPPTNEEHVIIGGTGFNDGIRSDRGDDTLHGRGGNDHLWGGDGADTIFGGDGDDLIEGLGGDDLLKGGPGSDVLDSGNGLGLDVSQGGTGDDYFTESNGAAATTVLAGPGNDLYYANNGGGAGDGDGGDDWFEGGASRDGFVGDSGIIINGQDINDFGNDVFVGGGLRDRYDGNGGTDIGIADAVPTDDLQGDFGFDWWTYRGTPTDVTDDLGNGLVVLGNVNRFNFVEGLSGGSGNDTLNGSAVAPRVGATQSLSDELLPASINDITGLAALVDNPATPLVTENQWLGGNILIGGPGSDTLQGRAGNDLIDGDAWLDVNLMTAANGTAHPSLTELDAALRNGSLNPADVSISRTINRALAPTGSDTAVFAGLAAEYTVGGVALAAGGIINAAGAPVTITHATPVGGGAGDGVDRVQGVEVLQFANGIVTVQNATIPLAITSPSLYDGLAGAVPSGSPGAQTCVVGVATAPQNVTAAGGVQSASVTWGAPSFDPGITGYQVDMSTDRGVSWMGTQSLGSGARSASFTGLTAPDLVMIRVASVTGAGRGPAGISNEVAVQAPGGGVTPPAAGGGGGSSSSSSSASAGGGAGGSIWTVKEVRPSSGPTTGGTRTLVLGWGFTGATSVTVGGVTAPEFKFVNDATIEIVTPPGALGWQELRVWLPNGSVPAGFQYVAPSAAAATAAPAAATTSTVVLVVGKPSSSAAKAPKVQASAGQVVTLKVKGLVKKSLVTVRVKIDGKWMSIGSTRTSKTGAATLPPFLAAKAGNYPVQITDANGKKSYVTVVVT